MTQSATRYCLKAMVLARLFAESTVLIAFAAAPVVLLLTGRMHSLLIPVQVLFYCLAAVGLSILPWFGFLTWQVRVDERGLTTDALFKHQFCSWTDMKKITRRANWNWQRYVIDCKDGALNFPVLLARCEELVHVIRQHLPAETGGSVALSDENPCRTFRYDAISLTAQIAQELVACVFVALFWLFFAFNWHRHFQNSQDAAMILIFCLAMTVVFIWRLFVVLTMPNRLELTRDRLVVSTLFSEKELGWLEISGLARPLPLLPEGFLVKTRRGDFLVGTGMDASDELQEILTQELVAVKRDMAFIAAAMKGTKGYPAAPVAGVDPTSSDSSSNVGSVTAGNTAAAGENHLDLTSPQVDFAPPDVDVHS